MKSLKLTILTLSASIFALSINAQNTRQGNWCKVDQIIQQQMASNPNAMNEFFDARDAAIKNSTSTKKPFTYIIPVVVHNITHSGGQGYVTKANIDAAINRLNIDFQRLNSDTTQTRSLFKPYADGINIEFRLAHKDPNGDCTEGIVRLEHPSSADFSDNNKSVSYWDSKKYFNIWLVDQINGSNPPSYIAGYAQFPFGFGGGINSTYGVVIDDTFFGANERTLTHEIGHCFGLLHTFQSGCGSNCSSSGDGVCDTPPVTTATYGCNTNQNSCSNDASGPSPYSSNVVDQIENYMSYDACQNMFSAGQVSNMISVLNSTSTTQGLAQLMTPTNLSNTGTADPYAPVICTPIADFSYNKEFICEGDAVTFTDQSYNATPTGFNWTFAGGTPTSSTASNPSITYNTAGIYSVTHRPSTSAGQDIITKTNIITVSSLTADYTSPVVDGFENLTTFNNEWIIGDSDDNFKWENTTITSATGSRSIRLLNYAASTSSKHIDYIVSPSYNLSTSSNKNVTFKVAFAQKNSNNTDRLFIYTSTNCGNTWSLKLPLVGSNLSTAPTHSNSFVPTSSEWTTKTMSLSNLGNSTNVRIKFQFESGGGNNIYIDDINIGGTTGIDNLNNIGSFNIYPNPTNASAKISFSLTQNIENLSIVIKNALGQEVTQVINGQAFRTGKYTLNIDENQLLSSGIYFIEFNADNNVKTEKLIVQ